MSKVIAVLLTDSEKWPNHSSRDAIRNLDAWRHYGGWSKFRGTPVRILAVPEAPHLFSCDTDFMWKVVADEAGGIESDQNAYVCRHQIQIGD